jgi:hypothetical protein
MGRRGVYEGRRGVYEGRKGVALKGGTDDASGSPMVGVCVWIAVDLPMVGGRGIVCGR